MTPQVGQERYSAFGAVSLAPSALTSLLHWANIRPTGRSALNSILPSVGKKALCSQQRWFSSMEDHLTIASFKSNHKRDDFCRCYSGLSGAVCTKRSQELSTFHNPILQLFRSPVRQLVLSRSSSLEEGPFESPTRSELPRKEILCASNSNLCL
jgi:hypothetical protein